MSEAAAETVSSRACVARARRVLVAAADGRRAQRAAAAPRPAIDRPHPPAAVPITITEVALTIAVASTPGLEAELLDRVAGDRGGDLERAGLDLDQPDDALDLDRADDSREAVARRELVPGVVALRRPAESPDLVERDQPAIALVAGRRAACPARSQRRRVSALTPSIRAASPMVTRSVICLSIA